MTGLGVDEFLAEQNSVAIFDFHLGSLWGFEQEHNGGAHLEHANLLALDELDSTIGSFESAIRDFVVTLVDLLARDVATVFV